MFVSESNINFNQFWQFQDRSIIHGGFHRGLSDNRIKVFLREATSLERNITDCPSPVIIFCLHFLTLLHVWAVWEYFHLLDNTPRENVDVLEKLVGGANNLMWRLNYAISYTNNLDAAITWTCTFAQCTMCNAHYTLQEADESKTKTNFQRLPSSEHVVHNQHYRWISGCSGASMCATLTQEQQYISGIHFELNVRQNNARWEKMQNVLMLAQHCLGIFE